MQYLELKVYCPREHMEIVQALLAEENFEAFVEEEDHLLAYVRQPLYNEDSTRHLLQSLPFSGNISTEIQLIENRNWNEEWEKSYQPVIIDDLCLVKAPFHNVEGNFRHIIHIEPKMAFGTGHHATTESVMRIMFNIDFENKKVMDFGTGSGILAILAEKLGAAYVLAYDNDEIAVENSAENLQVNGCSSTELLHGSIEDMPPGKFDVVIANITRNTILSHIEHITQRLNDKASLICSGFYTEDIETLKQAFAAKGLELAETKDKNNWAAALFIKN